MLRSSQGSAEGATECAVDAPIVLRDPGGKRCQYKRCQYKGTHASQDTCQYEGTHASQDRCQYEGTHASQDRCHYEGTCQYEGTHASRDRWQCPGCATGLRSVNTESCAMLSLTLTSTLIKYKEPPMACLIKLWYVGWDIARLPTHRTELARQAVASECESHPGRRDGASRRVVCRVCP